MQQHPTRRHFFAGATAVGAAALTGVGAVPASAAATAATSTHRATAGPSVGFVLSHEQFPTQRLLEIASVAEAQGFSHAWTSDHFQPWQDDEGHSMFPWETQALLARTTSRTTFGTGVTCPTYRHHPSQVAQAFASLGRLAPGRVFLGVGTGEAVNELAAVGRFDRYPERADRLVEAIALIRRLWTGERTTFDGRYYRTVRARLYDLPELPVPIYVAASGPHSAYLAGRHGDGWITGAADFTTPALRRAFERGARDAGKDPDAMPKLVETFVVVGDASDGRPAARLWRFTVDAWDPDLLYEPDPVRIQRKAAAKWSLETVLSGWTVSPDPAAHVHTLQQVIDAGGTPFVHSGQADQGRVARFYGAHVLPQLRRA